MPWSDPVTLWLLALVGMLASAIGTGWAIGHARRRGLLDAPGERRSHIVTTPRGGGIGIALVSLLACLGLAMHDPLRWGCSAAGLLLVAVVGWRDDHRPLSAWIRLLAHVLAGLLLALPWAMHGAPWMAFAACLLVPVLVNVWNFMDGIDGIATSQALLAALGLGALLDAGASVLAVAVAAACAGFLPFNLPRASIFLGDVGSGSLGYLLAVLVLAAAETLPVTAWPLLLLPATAFLVDAGLTLGRRVLRGERWWQPHVQHLYQQMARRFGHPRVTAAYAGWTGLAIGLMLSAMHASPRWILVAVCAFVALSAVTWGCLQGRGTGRSEGFDA